MLLEIQHDLCLSSKLAITVLERFSKKISVTEFSQDRP